MYIGSLCIRLQCVALPIHAWGAVVNMFCAGLGYVHGAMLIATSRQGAASSRCCSRWLTSLEEPASLQHKQLQMLFALLLSFRSCGRLCEW